MSPSAEPSSDIVVSRDGPVLILELNRAESMNAIGPTMLDSITGCLAEAERDDTVRAVVTTGRGPGWCAGADLDMLAALGDEGPDGVFHRTRGSSDFERAIDRLGPGRQALAMWDFPKPWIAAVNGAVAGGGLGLCLLHDVRFAAESAIFTTAFARLGVTVDMGLSFLLPRAVGDEAAADLLYTARVINAGEALALRLVRQVVDGDPTVAAVEYAHKIARRPALGVQATKIALRRPERARLERHLEFEWPTQLEAFRSPEVQERVRALLASSSHSE